MSATRATPAEPGSQWVTRPALSAGIQALVYLGPLAASALVARVLASNWPVSGGFSSQALRWLAVTLAALATLLVSGSLARRLLPLAALLKLALIFPDRAPARFAVARRAARPKQVLRQLEGIGTTQAGASRSTAQQVLELTAALSVHDRGTRGHCERVMVFTDMIAREMRLHQSDRSLLRWAALLHDIGKLRVPGRILRKPGRPDPREWRILRAHPGAGAELVGPLLPWLGEWGPAVAQHHEWFDGSGYPGGLRGGEISLAARIVSVADVFEVITAPRPYRRPIGVAAARRELVGVAGSQLDPRVVRAFLNVAVGELWPVVGVGALVSQIPLLGALSGLVGRLWPGLAGSGAAAAAAGALLVAGGLGHLVTPDSPMPPAPSPDRPTPTGTAPGAAQPPARSPAPGPGSPSPGPATVPASTRASAPAPTPSAPPPSGPTPSPSSSPTPAATPPVGPLRQLLSPVFGLLRHLGL